MATKTHFTVPPETPACICEYCGAVSLDSNKICKVQGTGTKADWCGTKALKPPAFCHNKANNERWQCRNCGQTALDAQLLCDPEKLNPSA